MNRIGLLLGLCATGALLATAQAGTEAQDMVGLQTANGKLAAEMLDLWFNQTKPGEAFDRYVSRDDFTDHYGKNSTHSFEEVKAAEIKMTTPDMHFQIKQIIAQGDLVFAHVLVTSPRSGQFGNELVEIMRFKDGKVTEHWDLHVPLQQDAREFFGR
ncbi:MAG: nuclear transport factor 2 family protein [Steroidobacteraceae bacterium]